MAGCNVTSGFINCRLPEEIFASQEGFAPCSCCIAAQFSITFNVCFCIVELNSVIAGQIQL